MRTFPHIDSWESNPEPADVTVVTTTSFLQAALEKYINYAEVFPQRRIEWRTSCGEHFDSQALLIWSHLSLQVLICQQYCTFPVRGITVIQTRLQMLLILFLPAGFLKFNSAFYKTFKRANMFKKNGVKMTAACPHERKKHNIDFYKLAHNNGSQRLGSPWMLREIKRKFAI